MKNRRLFRIPLLIGLLLLPLGCGDPTGPALQPSESCNDQPANTVVTFEDANLEVAVREALFISAQDDLTCGLLSGVTTLTVVPEEFFSGGRIRNLAGIQNLTNLRSLHLGANSITDINALSGLTRLTSLDLQQNSITDISALSEIMT